MGIFVTDARLKESVRLTGKVNTSALTIYNNCTKKAAASLLKAIGTAGISQYQSVPSVNPPTTVEEANRALLEDAEILFTKAEVLRRLPSIRFDSSGSSGEFWNDEPVSRLSQKDAEDQASQFIQAAIDIINDVFPDADVAVSVAAIDNPDKKSVYRFNQPYGYPDSVYIR